MPTEYLTPDQVCELIPGTTRQSLAQMRFKGNGPTYLKPGKRVLYRREDVVSWLDGTARTWTGDK